MMQRLHNIAQNISTYGHQYLTNKHIAVVVRNGKPLHTPRVNELTNTSTIHAEINAISDYIRSVTKYRFLTRANSQSYSL